MELISPAKSILFQLKGLLEQLDDQVYQNTIEVFSGASIGQHTRHIIEFYECLLKNTGVAKMNYDQRERNIKLETSVKETVTLLDCLLNQLDDLKQDKPIILCGTLGDSYNEVPSSISRELLYVIEHAVHHMAIIKIGILVSGLKVNLPQSFGVAESTIRYREQQQCAQ